MRRPFRRILLTVVALAVLVAAWVFLAPRQVPGGSAAYVVPSGTSMLPALGRGDLVVVRQADGYRVGDIVAYDSSELRQIVLHRIVGIEDGGYLLQGDNNTWIDSERPGREKIIGKLWFRVPSGGNVLAWFRTPSNAAVVGAVLGLAVVGGFAGPRVRRARRRRRDAGAPTRRAAPAALGRRIALGSLIGLGSITLAFSALAAVAFTRPLQRATATDVPYTQRGAFAYSARVSPGAVYQSETVATGEPVFLRLADEIALRFDYRFEADAPRTVSGTIRLEAELSDTTGWSRTIEVGPRRAFTGDTVVATGTLDLGQLQALMQSVDDLTGIPRSGYRLVVVPHVEIEGTIAGQPLDASFAPELAFELTPLLLRVEPSETVDGEGAEAFAGSQTESVTVPAVAPNHLSAFGRRLDVAAARQIAAIGGSSALLLLLVAAVATRLRRPKDVPSRIQAKYARRMVAVETGDHLAEGAIVDVVSIEALVQIADAYERMILHERRDEEHSYLVEGDVVVYRYRVSVLAGLEDAETETRVMLPKDVERSIPPHPLRDAPSLAPGRNHTIRPQDAPREA